MATCLELVPDVSIKETLNAVGLNIQSCEKCKVYNGDSGF